MSLAAIQAAVIDAVRDKDSVITSDARDQAIADAVSRYSGDMPRSVVVDVTALGGSTLSVPSGWLEGFSELRGIEYPVGQHPAAERSSDEYRPYRTPTGDEIRLSFSVPADDLVRVTYTAPHALDDSTDTIPAQHTYGVVALAASILCGQLAAYYATEGAPTIPADITDHLGKTERFRARAKDLLTEYGRVVVVPDRSKTPRAASATVALDSRDAFGRRRLFHPPGSYRP